MKSIRRSLIPMAFLGAVLALSGPVPDGLAAPGDPPPQEPPRPMAPDGKFRPGPEGPRDDRDPFHDLSPEQQTALREAVRKAWSDPAVLEARDKLKTAAESYQKAIDSAMERSNPEVADLIKRFRKDSSSELKIYGSMDRGPGGSPGGTPGGRDRKGFEGFLTMENPSFLRDLSPEKQKIYHEAHRKALETPEVRLQLESLKALRQSDEEMRKARIETIRSVHQSIREALLKADPRMKEILPEGRPEGGAGGPREPRDGRPEGAPEKRVRP